MQDKFIFKIVIDSTNVIPSNVKHWFEEQIYFKPKIMRGTLLTKHKTKKFNEDIFYNNIEKELITNNIFSLNVSDDNYNSFSISRGDFYSSIEGTYTYDIFKLYKNKILKDIDEIFQQYGGVTAFSSSGEDFFWQNHQSIDHYKRENKSMDHLHFKNSPLFEDELIVDIEHNPGHAHLVQEIWFTSCWTMWYGKKFFEHIPKEILTNFRDRYENKELKDGSIRIQLYENIWDYDLPEHRHIQWKFRRQVGIDEVAHSLMDEPILDDNPNPSLEIFTGTFEHGGVRLLKYYIDGNTNEVASKLNATECHVYELDENGNVIWSETQKI
jgi:hypothetical protein